MHWEFSISIVSIRLSKASVGRPTLAKLALSWAHYVSLDNLGCFFGCSEGLDCFRHYTQCPTLFRSLLAICPGTGACLPRLSSTTYCSKIAIRSDGLADFHQAVKQISDVDGWEGAVEELVRKEELETKTAAKEVMKGKHKRRSVDCLRDGNRPPGAVHDFWPSVVWRNHHVQEIGERTKELTAMAPLAMKPRWWRLMWIGGSTLSSLRCGSRRRCLLNLAFPSSTRNAAEHCVVEVLQVQFIDCSFVSAVFSFFL